MLIALVCAPVVGNPAAQRVRADSASINGRIAYQSDQSPHDYQDLGIFTADPDATSPNESPDITGTYNNQDPAWSPDGKLIAFSSNDPLLPQSHFYGIYVMDPDGSHKVKVVGEPQTHALVNEAPTWSPDGLHIAFQARMPDNTWQIFSIALDPQTHAGDPATLRQLTTTGVNELPAWSPDGTRIAFDSSRNIHGDGIYVMDPDGSNQVSISGEAGPDWAPAWSPDGTKLAFASHRSGTNDDIWIMDADGAQARQLTDVGSPQNPAPDSNPTWSPDGNLIAFDRLSTNSRIYAMPADGSGPMVVLTVTANDSNPSWVAGDAPKVVGPTLTAPNAGVPNGANGWFTGPVTGTVSASVAPNAVGTISAMDCDDIDVISQGLGTRAASATFTVSGDGARVVSCHATDSTGRSTRQVSVNVSIDATAPVLAPTFDAAVIHVGDSVTASANATDATSGIDTQGCDPVDTSTSGHHSVACQATDLAGNSASAAAGYDVLDPPPADGSAPAVQVDVAKASPDQPDGLNGWFRGSVTLTIRADDSASGGSAIQTIQCAFMGGGLFPVLTQLPGTLVGIGTPSATGTFAITGDGTHQLYCAAVDAAGNARNAAPQVLIDSTPPTLEPVLTPATPGIGDTPTADPGATDDLSGVWIAGCDAIDTSSPGGHSVTCRAFDVAGNDATASLSYSVRDQLAPAVTVTIAKAAPDQPDGLSGWFRGPATVTVQADESVSGGSPIQTIECLASGGGIFNLPTPLPGAFTGLGTPVATGWFNVTTEGSTSLLCGAIDEPGNVTRQSQLVRIDMTPPTLVPVLTPGSPLIGDAVTADAGARDDLSGVWISGCDFVDTSTPGDHSVTCTAFDIAGNSTTVSVPYAVHDQLAPAVTISIAKASSGQPDGSNGWFRGPVTVTVQADDSASGASSIQTIECLGPGGGIFGLPTALPGTFVGLGTPIATGTFQVSDAGSTSLLCGAVDGPGNATSRSVLVRIDATPPTLAPVLSPSLIVIGSVATAAPHATDTVSGIGSATCDPMDTSSPGLHTVMCRAMDIAGNTATLSVPYMVLDRLAPLMTITIAKASPATPDGLNGWFRGPVTGTVVLDDRGRGGSAISGIVCTLYPAGGQPTPLDITIVGLGTPTATASLALIGDIVADVSCYGTDSEANVSGSTKSVRIDATPPAIAWTGNRTTYGVLDTVAITCAASDALSGISTATCPNVSGPAWQLAAGHHVLAATATDVAGNVRQSTTSFDIVVTPSALATLTATLVQSSTAYRSLSTNARRAVDRLIAAATSPLLAIKPSSTPAQKARQVAAYKAAVDALVSGGWLTRSQGATLKALADAI